MTTITIIPTMLLILVFNCDTNISSILNGKCCRDDYKYSPYEPVVINIPLVILITIAEKILMTAENMINFVEKLINTACSGW